MKLKLIPEDSEEVLSWQKGDNLFEGLHHVAGVDISFSKNNSDTACAMLTVLTYPDLKVHNYYDQEDNRLPKQEEDMQFLYITHSVYSRISEN